MLWWRVALADESQQVRLKKSGMPRNNGLQVLLHTKRDCLGVAEIQLDTSRSCTISIMSWMIVTSSWCWVLANKLATEKTEMKSETIIGKT